MLDYKGLTEEEAIYGLTELSIALLAIGLICGILWGYIIFHKKKEIGEEKGK